MQAEELIDFEIAKAETAKRRQFNPYRKVMGKTPSAVEMAAWGHDRWMDFLRFTIMFIERDKEGEEKFKFTDAKRVVLDEFLSIPDHPFQEFIYRVNKWPGEHTNSDYRFKFLAISRVVLVYLKTHPSLINANMKILLESYPKRLGWVLAQYKIIESRAGEIIDRDGGTDTSKAVPLPSINQKMMNSLVIMADLYERIAGSIGEKELKDMKLYEKMKALKDLSFIFNTASKRQQTNHFTQINLNTKDVKGVEESMMDYIKKTQEK